MSRKIGFVGLGLMGQGMARNLLKAGFEVTVWNRTPSRMEPIVADGAGAGASPADVAAKSDIVVICVSDNADVETVTLGENGIIHGARKGALVVDCSSISPQVARSVAQGLGSAGIGMIDAPVSGGSEGAAKGTLSIMVGGADADVARAMPVLEAMGQTITHIGPIGSGQTVKLVNQVLVVGNALAMSEALLFAQAGGVDLQKTYDAISQGAAGSWMFTNRGPQVINRDWRPGFTISLQQKDLRLILETGAELGLPLITSSLVSNLYRTLEARGLGDEGNHALIKALEILSGVEVGEEAPAHA